MVQRGVYILLFLALLPIVFGGGISVTDEPLQSLVGPNEPVSFRLTLTNEQNVGDTFEVVSSVVDWELSSDPSNLYIGANAEGIIVVTLTPMGDKEARIHKVPITVASIDRAASINYVLDVKVVEHPILPRIVVPKFIESGSSFVFNVDIENRDDTSLEDLKVVLESSLFNEEQIIGFDAYERKTVPFTVFFDDTAKEGTYEVTVSLYSGENLVGFAEKSFSISPESNAVVEEHEEDGFLHYDLRVTIVNEGNTLIEDTYEYTSGSFASLFLDSDIDSTRKVGNTYLWEYSLEPGESYTLLISVDYLWPMIIGLLVTILIVYIIVYSRKDILVKKHVAVLGQNSDGTNRMKIVVTIKNKGFHRLNNINVMDHMPGSDVPRHFDGKGPMSITKKPSNTTQMIWRVATLASGEEHSFSYTTNTKRGLSQLVLPPAYARYIKGKRMIVSSSSRLRLFA